MKSNLSLYQFTLCVVLYWVCGGCAGQNCDVYPFGPVLRFADDQHLWRLTCIGDVTGNGRPDIVMLGEPDSSTLFVVENLGGRQYAAPVSTTLEGIPGVVGQIQCEDMNGDGLDDVIMRSNWSLSVVLSTGDGGFSSPVVTAPNPWPLRRFTIADVDRDGDLDVSVLLLDQLDRQPGQIGFWINDGDGMLVRQGHYTVRYASTLSVWPKPLNGLVATSLNGDDDIDFILATGHGTYRCLSDGAGGYGFLDSSERLDSRSEDIAVGFFDDDANLDVLTVETRQHDRYNIHLGDGQGGFVSTPHWIDDHRFWPDAGLMQRVIGDLDGDGRSEFVGDSLYVDRVLTFDETGTPQEPFEWPRNYTTHSPMMHDMDGDSKLDVVAVGVNFMQIVHGDGTLLKQNYVTTALPAPGVGLVLADLTGDGAREAVVAVGYPDYVLEVRRSDRDGGYEQLIQSLPMSSGVSRLVSADFDSDGDVDIVGISTVESGATMLLNDGAGGLSPEQFVPIDGTPIHAKVLDYDGDGDSDIAVLRRNETELVVLLSDGRGSLFPLEVPLGESGTHFDAGDLDHDGDPDLVLAAGFGGVRVLLHERGSYHLSQTFSADLPEGVALADLNSDGHLDVVSADERYGTVNIADGRGDGTFGPVRSYRHERTIDHLIPVPADIDNDGDIDVLFNRQYGSELLAFVNDGSGGLDRLVRFPAPVVWIRDLQVDDVDGDGDLDLVMASASDNSLYVARNRCGMSSCPGDIADDFGTLGADGMVSFGDFLPLLGLIGPCAGGTPGRLVDIADQ